MSTCLGKAVECHDKTDNLWIRLIVRQKLGTGIRTSVSGVTSESGVISKPTLCNRKKYNDGIQ